MANAVFNSLENYFSGNKLKPRLDWAKFDMSNIRTMDCDMGVLYPFYLEDCLPGDKIKIRNTAKVQALPLKNPIFNSMKLYTYYYYVPYYLLWHKFDRFIEGGRDGTYTAELPYVETYELGYRPTETGDEKYDEAQKENLVFGSNTLWDYMGFEPVNKLSKPNLKYNKIKVSAFPFAAYQRIWRDYFMNQDVQTTLNVNRWFPEDDFDFQLSDGKNWLMGQRNTDNEVTANIYGHLTGGNGEATSPTEEKPMLMSLRPRNWNKDYFTSMWFSPQRGPAQAVPIGSKIDFSASMGDERLEGRGYVNSQSATGQTGQIISVNGSDGDYNAGHTLALKNALNKANITGGFTLADLHLAQQIEIWMIRNMSVKAQYNEFLRIHFNDAPLDERLTKPAYIGGTVQDIQISEVLQSSQTTETSAQGTATGHATSYDNGFVGTYYSHEYGLIIGLCCIMPEAYYETGIDRHWTKTNRYDFYFPEFADLEPQAVIRKEIQGKMEAVSESLATEYIEKPIGYIGRYDEYRHHKNLAVGAMRNPETNDFKSWVIKRDEIEAEGLVSLNQMLISTCKSKEIWKSPPMHYVRNMSTGEYEWRYTSNINHDAWATGKTMNPFIVQIGIGCEMVRAMPYVNDPTKQGR